MTYRQILRYYNHTEGEVNRRREQIENPYFNAILNAPLKTINDLLRIINMVYAWMPRMLAETADVVDFHEIDLENLLRLSKAARRGNITNENEKVLISQFARLSNNHMVGASKVLMVLNQEKYPIFDSRVMKTWNKYILNNEVQNEIRKLTNPSIIKDKVKCVENYIYYKETIQEYAGQSRKTVREYEFLLFFINGNIKS